MVDQDYAANLGVRGDTAVVEPVVSTEPAEIPQIDFEGKQYPVETVKTWKQDSDQKSNWQKTLKQEEMANAQVRQALSVATGRQIKSFADLEAADFTDFTVMAQLNGWLRGHPDARPAFESSLKAFFEAQGATPGQATAAAKETLAAVKTAGTGEEQIPAWAKPLFEQVERVQGYIGGQAETALENHMEGTLEQVIKAAAPDLKYDWGYIRERILIDLYPYDVQTQIMPAARSGELSKFIQERAQSYVESIRERKRAEAADQAAALADPNRRPGVTTPLGGKTAGQAVDEGAKRGAGMGDMNKRMRGGLGLG